MADVAKTVVHSAVQLGVGVVVGGVCDASFPAAPNKHHKLPAEKLAWVAAEATLQIIANGLITAGVVKLLDRLDAEMADPTGAMAYGWALQAAQPQLMNKLCILGRHISAMISKVENDALSEFTDVGMSKSDRDTLKQKFH
jgi:hypothetical protein